MGAAGYIEDEEAWKCPKHPSKRRRKGVCPTCLRHRLTALCPDCATVRPCSCAASCRTSSSSSSSSSSFNRFYNLPDGEPVFRRSRSLATVFLRSRSSTIEPAAGDRTLSFLSVLKKSKTKRSQRENENLSVVNRIGNEINDENFDSNNRIEDFARMITRSRSVSAAAASEIRRLEATSSPAKGKLWNFPSLMKIFGSSKTSSPKIVLAQDRLPLHRG